MYNRTAFRGLVALIILASLILSACGAAQTPTQSAEPVTLRIAVLRILDALPMYVAEQEGLYSKNGVKVEFIPAASAAERDQIIIAGQADGMINEIVSTLLYNKDNVTVQIVRFARVSTSASPMYHILASQQSGITTPEGFKGVEIGISQGTIIEYMVYRMLQAKGLSSEDIKTIAVPKMDERLALLQQGQIKGALLPDPLSFLALQQGGVEVLNDTENPQFGHSTVSFRKEVIDQHPEAIRAFLAAYEEAVQLIKANPEKYTTLLTDQKLVPASLVGTFPIPPYPPASVPDETMWNDVLTWAKEKGLVAGDVKYQDSVNASFLPK